MKKVTIAHLHHPLFDVAVEVDEMANIDVAATAHVKGYAATCYDGCGLTLGETRSAYDVASLAHEVMIAALDEVTKGKSVAAQTKVAARMRYEVEHTIIQDALQRLDEGADLNLFKDGDLGVFYAYTLR